MAPVFEVKKEIPGKAGDASDSGNLGVHKRRMNMEKRLCNAAYWIGVISTVVALITRGLAIVGIFVPAMSSGKMPLSYRSFLDGAMLFFVMAIASSVTLWAKAQKS